MKKTLIVHSYDANTGEYNGDEVANLCPVMKDVYHYPANTTTIPPLSSKSGFAIVFISKAWQYVEDHRGQTVYEKDTGLNAGIVQSIGVIPDTLTLIAPGPNEIWQGDGWIEDPVYANQQAMEAALKEKWPDDIALMNDIIARGADAVRADQEAIKAQYGLSDSG